jgi:hypothetical protein
MMTPMGTPAAMMGGMDPAIGAGNAAVMNPTMNPALAHPSELMESEMPPAAADAPSPAKRSTKKVVDGAKIAARKSVQKTRETTKAFFLPNAQGVPWYKDQQKLMISGLGVVTLGALGFLASGGRVSRREAATTGEWFHNIFHGRAFKNQQQWLLDEMERGFKGPGGHQRKKTLKKRLDLNGTHLYMKNLAQRLKETHRNPVQQYTSSFGPREEALKEARDIWLMHQEMMRHPHAYKDFGFSSLSSGVQQTQTLMNMHLAALKKDVSGWKGVVHHGPDAKERRDLISGYETLSEKWLNEYITRHNQNPSLYPVGQGAVQLGKQVYLRNVGSDLKQGREKEALERVRIFLALASGDDLVTGAGKASPKDIFTPKEWHVFTGHLQDLIKEGHTTRLKIRIPGRSSTMQLDRVQAFDAFHQHSHRVMAGDANAVASMEASLQALYATLSRPINGHMYPHLNANAVLNDLQKGTAAPSGATFSLLQHILMDARPERNTFAHMG